jgi:peroxiredoxin Q/BCP
MTAELSSGDPAPSLIMETTDGSMAIPADDGRGLVVFFYPRDNTPGCTIEARAFSELRTEFSTKGFDIVGVSRDSMKSHHKFIEKQSLTVPLAVDEDGSVCEAFGVWREKKNYGRIYMGIERSTFVIASNGTIIDSWRKVKTKGHAEQVLSIL